MSDSGDSTVTYTKVSSPFEDLLDIRSPGVVGPEYEGLPWMLDDLYVQVVLQALPSPDYMFGPEEPEQAPPLPDLVPELVYLELMIPEDEVLPAEEQPLPATASPIADSPGYVPKSDLEEDLEEDDDEDPEEDPVDYPANGGDDGDDEDESSDDDEDDDIDIKGDKEEEDYPAPANFTAVALPAVDHALSTEGTESFKTDESAATPPPHPAYRATARMSIRDEPPTPFWSEAGIARLLTIPSPPPSPLSPWSSPLPQILSCHYLAKASSTSHPLPLPSPIVLPCIKASIAILRAAAPSTYILAPQSEAPPSGIPPILPIPLPTPPPPLLPPSTDHRADVCKACLPPWKRLCFAFGPGYEVGESSSAPTARPDRDFRRDYGFIATLDDEIIVRSTGDRPCHDWIDVHMFAQPGLWRLRPGCLERLRDELQAADRRRQTQLTEALKLMKTLQTQLTALQSRQGPARGLTHPDVLEEAGTEGVVELTQWVEKMETVFRISNYFVENQVKFSTCTLLGNALTWWNSHVRIVVKGTGVIRYNQRFQELALLCVRMFPEESNKIERYVGSLPNMIHGSVVASKPKTMQEATEIATDSIAISRIYNISKYL
ncbi:hypothetical protein Tco_0576266 [Tanacetum coccineum]